MVASSNKLSVIGRWPGRRMEFDQIFHHQRVSVPLHIVARKIPALAG